VELLYRGFSPGYTNEVAGPALLATLDKRGIHNNLAQEWLDHFLRAGWIEGRWLVGRGGNRLETVTLRDTDALLSWWLTGLRYQFLRVAISVGLGREVK